MIHHIEEKSADDSSLHVIGNGSVCAYLNGIDIRQIFGPVLSTPPFAELVYTGSPLSYEARREYGAAIWHYRLSGGSCGSICDFAHAYRPVFFRKFSLTKRLTFQFSIHEAIRPKVVSKTLTGLDSPVWLFELPEGVLFYTTCREDGRDRGYPTDRPFYLAVAAGGDGVVELREGRLTLSQSSGLCVFSFSDCMGECLKNASEALRGGPDCALEESRRRWRLFTEGRKSRMPLNGIAEQAVDNVAVMIKSQQGREGGILAGQNYHLSYVRDNYGTFRGLMAMGCTEEAKALLSYYAGVFSRKGEIHNAQGIGNDAFHIHENDQSEIPGYLVLMATEYYRAIRDAGMFRSMLPLIGYAVGCQFGMLKKGMVPFNGDETYIAGGILERAAITDGSAEATLLFHRGCKELLGISEEIEMDSQLLEKCHTAVSEIERTFCKNFVVDGKIACNNRSYSEESAPLHRHGVMQCGHGFGETFRNKSGLYVCADCIDREFEPVQKRTRFINSVILMPDFIGSGLIPEKILRPGVKKLITDFMENGRLPSGGTTAGGAGKMVGYDFGLLLFSLHKEDAEAAGVLAQKMLSLRDEDGSWCEYYEGGKICGTRCRPWESGINIAALLRYLDEIGPSDPASFF